MEPSQESRSQSASQLNLSGNEPLRGSPVGVGQIPVEREIRQRVRADRLSRVTGVTILPPRGEPVEKKSVFRLLLSLDSTTDPSSQKRRTGTVAGLELEVEEKDLQPLARLTGRQVMLHYVLWTDDVQSDALQLENTELRESIQHLQRKLRAVQDQLQYSVEAQIKDQRL